MINNEKKNSDKRLDPVFLEQVGVPALETFIIYDYVCKYLYVLFVNYAYYV